MDSPDKIYERFFSLLKERESKYGRGFNKFLHHETGLSTSYLSLLLSRNKRASQKTQMRITKALNVDYQTILQPEKSDLKSTPLSKSNIIEYTTPTEKKHFEVIQSFEDPEYALMLNSYLVELEKLDVEAYEEIGAKVRGLVRKKKREIAEEARQAEEQVKQDTPDEKQA